MGEGEYKTAFNLKKYTKVEPPKPEINLLKLPKMLNRTNPF